MSRAERHLVVHTSIVLAIRVSFWRHIFNLGDSTVNELLFGKETLENNLTILLIKSMQVLSLYLFFGSNFSSIDDPELWHVEQALQSVVLAALDGIHAQINISQKWQVFDVLQLAYLGDVIQAEFEELERLNGFQTLQ